MKKINKTRVWMILTVVLVFLFTFGVAAEDSSYLSHNMELCKQKNKALQDYFEDVYNQTQNTEVFQNTMQKVNSYSSQINNIYTLPEATTRNMDDEIETLYLRGLCAGKITWIYESNRTRLSEAGAQAVKTEADALILSADQSDLSTLSALSDQLCVAMNRAVYIQLLEELKEENDSAECLTLIEGAKNDVKNKVESSDILGSDYETIYTQTKAQLAVQRLRDQANACLRALYPTLCPGGSFENDTIPTLFRLQLQTKNTVAEMNALLKSSVETLIHNLIPDNAGEYAAALRLELLDRVADEWTSADAENRIASPDFLWDDFTLRLARANAKDKLKADFAARPGWDDGTLTALAEEYLADDGILAGCSSQAELDAELTRANLRADWYEQVAAYRKSIRNTMAPHDDTALLAQLESIFSEVNSAILAVSWSDADAETAWKAAYDRGTERLESLLNDARAEKFIGDYADVLADAEPAPEKDRILAAITAFDSLSPEVRSRLESERTRIAERLRDQLLKEIRDLNSQDILAERRREQLEKLCDGLNALSFGDGEVTLASYRDDAEVFLSRAQAMKEIHDFYAGLLNDSNYDRYRQDDRDDMDRVCTEAETTVLNAQESGLKDITEETKRKLARLHSVANLYLAAGENPSDHVREIIEEARNNLDQKTTLSDISAEETAALHRVHRALAAEKMLAEIEELRQTIAAYPNMSEEEKAALTNRANALSDYATRAEGAADSTALQQIRDAFAQAKADLIGEADVIDLRAAAIAEIRKAAGDPPSQRLVFVINDAWDKLSMADTIEKVNQEKEAALHRVRCALEADVIAGKVDTLIQKIKELPNMSEKEKNDFLTRAEALKSYIERTAGAADSNALEQEKNAYAQADAKLLKEAQLADKRAQMLAEGNAYAEEIHAAIEKLENLSESDRKTLADNYRDGAERFAQKVSATDENGLADLLSDYKTACDLLLAEANRQDLKRYGEGLLEDARNGYSDDSIYSPEHFEEIRQILSKLENDLSHAPNAEESLTLRRAAEEKIREIPRLVDESRSEALDALRDAYDALTENRDAYSSSALSELEKLYRNGTDSLTDFDDPHAPDTPTAIADDVIARMREVRRDRVSTPDGNFRGNGKNDNLRYPADYTIRSGLWGLITANGALTPNTRFTVSMFTDTNIIATINRLAKDNCKNADGSALSRSLQKKLRQCDMLTGLDITLTGAAGSDGTLYRVSFLLPDDIRAEDILGIVFLGEGDSMEFYNCEIDGQIVTFETSHFSEYYLLTDSPLNFTPLLLALCILILMEALAVLCLVLLRIRRSRAAKANASLSCFAAVPALPVVSYAVRKMIPRTAPVLLLLLGGCAVLLGFLIAYLLRDELLWRRALREAAPATPEPTPEPQEEIPAPVVPEEPCEPEPVAEEISEPLERITPEEADRLMSDSDAQKLLVTIPEPTEEPTAQEEETEEEPVSDLPEIPVTYGTKKTQINLDVISQNFEPGELVCPATLKEKRLIPASAGFVKVLARGVLDKPLTVAAQDFSAAAIKMIALTGGRAVRVGKSLPAPKRSAQTTAAKKSAENEK